MILTKEILQQICLTKQAYTTHDCWGRYETYLEDKDGKTIYTELCNLLGYDIGEDENDE